MNIASIFRFFAKQVIQQSFFAAWLGFFILLISGSRVNAQSPGNCINFDGVNDYITTTNSITAPSAFTIECWVRSDEIGNSTNYLLNRPLVNFKQTSPADDNFTFKMSNQYYLTSCNSPYYNLLQGYQKGQWNNKWHHVAVSSSAATGTKIYVDGETMDSTANYANLTGRTGKWVIGLLGSNVYNKGSMDELRIWNTVRTKEQIKANMYGEIDGAANSSSLYLYYKFNENSGTTVTDWSNNGNTGTLKNFALSGTTSNWIESYASVIPTNVIASNITYNSATLSWTPPANGSVDNYYLEYGYDLNNAGNTITKINVGNVTTYTLTGLSQNYKYYYRIRANKSTVENQGGYNEGFNVPGGFYIPTFASFFITAIQPIVVNCTNNPVTAYADGITTTVIDSNMTFTKNAGFYHYKFKVFFVSGKQYGDSLYYRSSLPSGITAAYDTASGILTFTASTQNVAASVWQGLLRNVTFKAYKKGNNTRKIAYAFGDYTYGPNAHFYIPYLCSPSCSKTWTNAKDAGFLAYGCTGYLATITSQAENDTIKSLTAGNNIWIGLSDDYAQINAATGTTTYANQAASEGKFYWVTGPEKGTQITSTNSPVTTISGKYNNWRSGEPSNSGSTEHATEFYGSDGTWNDADGIASKFYILEFGGMQGDAANVLVDTVTINIATASEPANSLNFDGTNDYVAIPDNDSLDLTNNYTIEAWIKPNNFTFLGGIVSKYHTSASSGFILRLTGGAPYSGITFDELVTANGVLTQGKWQHVAAVKNGSNRYVYINGQQVGLTGTALTTANNTDSVMIGVDFATTPRYFDGNIDEVRIWRTARSQDSIIANMNKPISPASTSLVAYYNMNQGVAGGNNAGLNSLYDQTNNNFTGTLKNVANSGSTSNWVESYAMVVPVTTAATNKYSLGFVANWTTPVTGVAQKYYFDLSTAADFSSFVSGYNNLDVSNVNSYTISGLTASTTYYYRVRAEKSGTGVTTTGGYSNVTTVVTNAPETLVATEAANRTSTSFTAKWSAPQLGTISSYTLDVSTNNTFSSPISGSPFTVADTSKNITGLTSNTTYYYRVRATNYNNSNTISTTTNAPFASISSSLSSICLNGTTPVITFTGSGSTSLPYTFTYKINSGSNQTISTSGGASTVTLNVPVNTAGTYVYALVRVQDASSGSNLETASTTVTVNDKPTPTFISAPAANTCSGIDVSYTTESGQTNYTWNVSGTLGTDYTITSGGIGTSSNTVTLKWLTAGSKTVTVNYQNTAGCTSNSSASNTTTVGITPTVSAITGTANATVGLSSQLSDVTLNGVWSSSDMSVAFVNATGRVTASSEGTTTIYYTVTSGSCSSAASTLFTVNAAPSVSITSITPTTAIPGNTMTVTGTGFLGTSSIYVGEYFVDNYTVNSATSISLTIPEGTGSNLKLFVTAPGGIDSTSGANLFTYYSVPAPTITSFTPTSAGYHYTVVITGTNFLNAQQVTFGDVVVYSYTVNSATQITAVIDTGSTGSVSVTTAGGTATASGFTFLPCSGQPVVNAGAAMSACNNVSANIASTATASNYASLVWSTTDGSGSFANNTTANALSTTTYTPSAADLSRGYVILKLKANPNTGCLADSSTKVLTYKYTSSSSTSATACTSYTWNGTTYTTSGVKTYTTTNAVGCDSVVTLTLTIKDASTYTQTVSACNSYTWHGTTYTSSTNTPTWTTTNAVGCDSVVTLNLTINTGTHNAETQSACGSYIWNGNTYTTGGDYTFSYTDGNGCASADTLHLTIGNEPNISYSTPHIYTKNVAISPLSPTNTGGAVLQRYYADVTTIAGDTYSGNQDGTGTNALFFYPTGLTRDAAGNLYIADFYNNNIRKVTPAGVATTIAGVDGVSGYLDTTVATAAQFNFPTGIVADSHDNLFIADSYNNVIRKISTSGVVSTFAGTVSPYLGDYADGTGPAAKFNMPYSLAIDASDNLYLSDFNNNRIRKITPDAVVTTLAGNGVAGFQNGTGTAAQFNSPQNLVVDPTGNVYVCDVQNNKIRKITTSGDVSTFAGSTVGNQNGNGTAAKFNNPIGITIDRHGNFYVADQGNDLIRKITPAGVVTTFAGSTNGHVDAAGANAKFDAPNSLITDPTGEYLYLTDVGNAATVRRISIYGYAVTPNLPSGLSLSTSGVISGTPTVASPATNYTVSAYNECGSSSFIVNIAVCAPTTFTQTIAACGSYTWHGTTYTSSTNTPTWTTTNVAGCDSVITLNLTINTGTHNATTETACETYTWNGTEYTTSGDYTYSYTNGDGCASFDTLHLTINYGTHNAETQVACETYNWNGTEYTTSGDYTYNYTNGNGCASVDTLHLTVNYGTHNATSVSSCDAYVWNGNSYNTSGDYTYSYNNADGCASVDTLHFTFVVPGNHSYTVVACDAYDWNGVQYTANGTYTYVRPYISGCALSVDTLHLTIATSTTATITASVSGVNNVCSYGNTGEQLTYSLPTSPGITSYFWTVPTGVTIVSGQGTNSISVTISSDLYTSVNKRVKVYATSPCGTGPAKIFYMLTQAPVTPSPIVASTLNVCPSLGTNIPVIYKIPKVYELASNGRTVTSYIWTAQNGTTTITHLNGAGELDTAISILFAANFTTSNLSVQALNPCGVSGTRSMIITRSNPSVPSIISGPTNACEYIGTAGQIATYSIGASPVVVSYTWTLPSGATNISGQGTSSISFKYPVGFTSGSVSVKATNLCGTSASRTLLVSRLNPLTPSNIDVINISSCPVRQYTYSVAGLPANAISLDWSVPQGGTIVSGQGTRSILVSYSTGVITGFVSVKSVGNCGVSGVKYVEIKMTACPANPGAVYTKASNSNSSSLDVSVFPNPTTNLFKLKVAASSNNTLVKARLLDLQGRAIKTMMIKPNETIPMGSDLKSGVYFLEVNQGGELKTVRMVKY